MRTTIKIINSDQDKTTFEALKYYFESIDTCYENINNKEANLTAFGYMTLYISTNLKFSN